MSADIKYPATFMVRGICFILYRLSTPGLFVYLGGVGFSSLLCSVGGHRSDSVGQDNFLFGSNLFEKSVVASLSAAPV